MAWRRAGGPDPVVLDHRRSAPDGEGGSDGDALRRSAAAGVIVGRRRGLPGHRAVLGGLLVAASGVIVFASVVSAAGRHGGLYLVADRALPAGTVIGPGDTTTARFQLPADARAHAFTDQGPLIGRALEAPVAAGELIEGSMLAPSGAAGLRPVSIPVNGDSLDAVGVGSTVDVLATAGSSAGATSSGPAQVTLIMRGVTLLGVNRANPGILSAPANGAVVVTIGVTNLSEAEQLVEAAAGGTVDLVQAEPSDGSGPGPGPGG